MMGKVSDLGSSISDAASKNLLSESGTLVSESSIAHHANVATIRRDLPMLLPSVRLLIGILSGPKNIARRTEVCVCT